MTNKILKKPSRKWPMVELGELCDTGRGRVISKKYIKKNKGEYPVYSSQTKDDGIFGHINTYDYEGEWVTWTTDRANAGTVFYRNGKFNCTNICGTLNLKKQIKQKLNLKYLALILGSISKNYVSQASGNPKIMNNVVEKIKIPLPSLSIQKDIVKQVSLFGKNKTLKSILLKYKEQKKGLMQQLLTGKKRIKI